MVQIELRKCRGNDDQYGFYELTLSKEASVMGQNDSKLLSSVKCSLLRSMGRALEGAITQTKVCALLFRCSQSMCWCAHDRGVEFELPPATRIVCLRPGELQSCVAAKSSAGSRKDGPTSRHHISVGLQLICLTATGCQLTLLR
ncbi:unnamed protein product [Prorocentrum cordatum]|uniref:Uncharacterized protein n=1 Tax=Prorocentrum cordatum TaxID=2364126 RepID=A0ABN9W384_9DINO|nr:unnamed protein product [Polarella glacialis]